MNPWQAIGAAGQASHHAFRAALGNARDAQASVLAGIIADNRETQFGRRHDFAHIGNAAEFRARVPVAGYDAYSPDIMRIAAGEADVLFAGVPEAFEETGGSTAGPKLIPYPSRSLAAFRAAVLPWLADLLAERPGIRAGRAYFAVSQVARAARTTPAGHPIGMSDAGYLGTPLLEPFAALSVVPAALARESTMERWSLRTLVHLASAADLSLISVWSPSFFTLLLRALVEHGEHVADAIESGMVAGCEVTPDPKRADVLRRALAGGGLDTTLLWPHLDTISCWTHAAAAGIAAELQAWLPQARMQAKGLLATEGVISIPLERAPFPVLAIRSAYYEFIDDTGDARECHQLREDETYRVVMSTPGGLYRYDVGDRVRCRGFHETAPMLEFMGRNGPACDLVGEKLDEAFVAPRLPGEAGMSMLVPSRHPAGYVLVVDAHRHDERSAQTLAASLDRSLQENPQYAYARRLGQLAPLTARRVARLQELYTKRALERGQRMGDIKPAALYNDGEWLLDKRLSGTDEPAADKTSFNYVD